MNLVKIPIREIPGHEEFLRIRHLLPNLDLEKGPWIAGGSLLRMITGEPFWAGVENINAIEEDAVCVDPFIAYPKNAAVAVNKQKVFIGNPEADIDFWFSDEETYKRVVTNMRSFHGKPHETDNAKSFKVEYDCRRYLLQCIHKRFFGSAEEILNSFDFTVAQIASDLEYVVMPDYVMDDIRNRQLRLASGRFNKGNFLKRVFKYTSNGYNPEPGLLTEITSIDERELVAHLTTSIDMVDTYGFL